MADRQDAAASGSAAADKRGEPSTSKPQADGPTAKPRRFMPTVTQRRKKPADAAVKQEDDGFKDLMSAAQEPANWERAQKTRPRPQQARTAQTVVFGVGSGGGGFSATSRAAPKAAGARAKPGEAGTGASGGAGGGPGGGAGSKGRLHRASGAQVAPKAEGILGVGEDSVRPAAPGSPADESPLDYSCYYPATLPAHPPGEWPRQDLDPASALPQDLSLLEDEVRNVADALGLLSPRGGLPKEGEQPFLLQMPPLPAAPREEDGKDLVGQRARLLTAQAPAVAPGPPALHELPPGRLGRLRVHASGRVRLQVGDALLELQLAPDARHAQQLVALHAEAGTAAVLGAPLLRAFCTPDAEQLLGDEPLPPPLAAEPQLGKKGAPAARVKQEPGEDVGVKAAGNGGAHREQKPGGRGKQVFAHSDDSDDAMQS